MENSCRKRICVIGAGSSGLAAIKACREENFDVVCYEKSDSFGGLWRFNPSDEEGRASVMKATVINTSKEMSAFSDFPPPSNYSNFMHNSIMLEYFQLYAKHFDLLKNIEYDCEVTNVRMADDYETTGRWQVSCRRNMEDSKTEIFDGVMVCAGHHIYPNEPEFEGLQDFKGKVFHTHSLKSGSGFEDQNVLVIGMGNSAVDIAVDVSKISKKVYLSTRRGSWIFSRRGLNGKPYDLHLQKRYFLMLLKIDPFGILNYILESYLNMNFDHEKFGLKPKHHVLNAHFTINDALPNCILSGLITVKQDIQRFTKNGVIFKGETEVIPLDAVIMATGYEIKFPFLSKEIFQINENYLNLYKRVFPSYLPHPTLAFIALVQPLGAMFPIAEAQSRWFAQLMAGNVKLPSKDEMERYNKAKHLEDSQQYVVSTRHIIQVSFIPYMDEICSEFDAKPNMWKMAFTDPKLFYKLMFGPSLPYQYRLQGPHCWKGARDAILTADTRTDAPLNTVKKLQ